MFTLSIGHSLELFQFSGGVSETNELMRKLMTENKRMREELIRAIRDEMAPKPSETEPLYDTIGAMPQFFWIF